MQIFAGFIQSNLINRIQARQKSIKVNRYTYSIFFTWEVKYSDVTIILNTVNNLLKELKFEQFVSSAMHYYGVDSFWEGRGEVKFRKKYLKKSLQNLMKEYDECEKLIRETYRFIDDDRLERSRFRVPKFEP